MGSKKRIPLVVVLVALLVTHVAASPTTIGVFFDTAATDCDASVTPFVPFNVYVSVVLGTDEARGGCRGAEFRVDGLTGLVSSVIPNPAAFVAIGDPTAGQCNIAFSTCMTGDGPRHVVQLYTIVCLSTVPVIPRRVIVDRTTNPCDSGCCRFAPCLVLCDDPVFTRLYVLGGQALINNGSCTVDVQPTTWSGVKSIFTARSVLQLPAPLERRR